MTRRVTDYFASANLQIPRASLVSFALIVKIPVNRCHGSPQGPRQRFELLRDCAHPKHIAFAKRGDELEIAAAAIEPDDVDGPGDVVEYFIGVLKPTLRPGGFAVCAAGASRREG
jgi:hypothetical protein